jgi:hypothetical protein
MATQESYDWHLQKRLEAQRRVALIIQNGTKASSSDVIAKRMMNPSYKGLPDNSTGSKNRPFFAMKDESHVPLEAKIAARGGVLHTKVGKEYGYEILKRRAVDTKAQELAKEGIPPPEEPLLTLSEEESKTLEFNNILQTISDAVEGDEVSVALLPELRNGTRLMITLSPTFSSADLTDIVRVCDNILEDIGAMKVDITKGLAFKAGEEKVKAGALSQVAVFVARLRAMAQGMIGVVNSDIKSRKLKAKSLGKEIFNVSGIIEKREREKVEVPEEEPEEEPEESSATASATTTSPRPISEDERLVTNLFDAKNASSRLGLERIYLKTFPLRDATTPAKMKNALIKHIKSGKTIKR